MSDYLPYNLLPEILFRLPVESILRFRCVCKEWCSLIASPDFISLHLSHSLSTSGTAAPLLLLRYLPYGYDVAVGVTNKEVYSIYFDSENLTHAKHLIFPFYPISHFFHFDIVGFCNGLFCLSDNLAEHTNLTILWNPAIRKSLLLPMPAVSWDSRGPHMFCLGFGFDPKTQDFKVVRLAYLKEPGGNFVVPPEVDVYSLSTGLWKPVGSKGIDLDLVSCSSGMAYVNGAIHWVAYCTNKRNCSLLVFGLSSESFSKMGLPKCLLHVETFDLSVSVCEDLISLFWYEKGRHRRSYCDRCVIWVMKEYGNMESWMEKFVVVLDGGIRHAIGFRGNGEFLLKDYDGYLQSYAPESKVFRDLHMSGWSDSFFSTKYSESLVLLDGSSGAKADPDPSNESEVHPQLDEALKELELFKRWDQSPYTPEGHIKMQVFCIN